MIACVDDEAAARAFAQANSTPVNTPSCSLFDFSLSARSKAVPPLATSPLRPVDVSRSERNGLAVSRS
jgi:hypothetical protein